MEDKDKTNRVDDNDNRVIDIDAIAINKDNRIVEIDNGIVDGDRECVKDSKLVEVGEKEGRKDVYQIEVNKEIYKHAKKAEDSKNANNNNVVKYNSKENQFDDKGLTTSQVEELLKIYGPNEVVAKEVPEWRKVLVRYTRVTPVLLLIACLLSACVEVEGMRDWLSFTLLLLLCNVMVWADYLGERSTSNAIREVNKLKSVSCTVKRDGEWCSIRTPQLVPGDVVWLKAGVIVPADGLFLASATANANCTELANAEANANCDVVASASAIASGSGSSGGTREGGGSSSSGTGSGVACEGGLSRDKWLSIDESAITGESCLVSKYDRDELLSGSVVQRGEGVMIVTKTGANSFYGKTVALLAKDSSNNANHNFTNSYNNNAGHLRYVLDSASTVLTLAAVFVAALLLLWEWLHPNWRNRQRYAEKASPLLLQPQTLSHADSPSLDSAALAADYPASYAASHTPFYSGGYARNYAEADDEGEICLLLKRAFTLIAAVIPAAMPVVTTTVLAVGALIISKENAVLMRLSAIEEAAGVEILCTDKTGTLTLNVLTLSREEISVEDGYSIDDLLVFAALATSPNDPEAIDIAINEKVDTSRKSAYDVLHYIPFNPIDKRAESIVREKESKDIYLVTKGAPHIILDMVCSREEEDKRRRIEKIINEKAKRGLRTLGVAIKKVQSPSGVRTPQEAFELAEKTRWELVGYLCLFDPPRSDTKQTLELASEMGVKVKMLTGDQQAIAVETARCLGLGDNISNADIFKDMDACNGGMNDAALLEYIKQADGFAGVYPDHKYIIVDLLQRGGYLVAMTGDGVNDAPALKRATVGIAVSGSTEAARSASDIALLSPGLSSIISVFRLSRQIFKRIEAYITFRLHSSIMTLLFWAGCVVIFNFEYPTWVLVLIAIINDFVLMACSRDNVPSSNKPLTWSMLHVISTAAITALIMTICMLLYIYLSDPAYGVNWWEAFGVPRFDSIAADSFNSYPSPQSKQTSAGVWLLFTACIQLSFHSCRTYRFALRYSSENKVPSLVVLIPQAVALIVTLFLSIYWREEWKISSGPRVVGISWLHAIITLLWGFVWFLLTDSVKLLHCTYLWPYLAKVESEWKRKKQRKRIASSRETDDRQAQEKMHAVMKNIQDERKKRMKTMKDKSKEVMMHALQQQYRNRNPSLRTRDTENSNANSKLNISNSKIKKHSKSVMLRRGGGEPFKRFALDSSSKGNGTPN